MIIIIPISCRLFLNTVRDLKESDTVVDILTMGNYEFNVQKPINNVQAEMKKLNLTNWFSSKHNMAFTIDRALWSRIKSCQFAFCTFDDYNWDWSLQFIINECLKQKLWTLVTVVPRYFIRIILKISDENLIHYVFIIII